MTVMNPVVHFEMPAEDRKRMCDFYAKTFGWKINQLGPEMGDYVVVDTSERGEDGFPAKRGMINGGFFQKHVVDKHAVPSVVIGVEDIAAHIEKVKAAGGTMLDGPMEIPGTGIYASFLDTEGNKVSMIQPTRM